MKKGPLIGIALFVLLGTGGALWWTYGPSILPFAESRPEAMEDMPGMPQAGEGLGGRSEVRETSKEPRRPMPETGIVQIPPERLQTIGVKYEEVARRPLEKVIRTVGRVDVDERRVARVNLKFEGWIEDLLVSAVGDHVKKGQILFTLYSPDLVATQEEYLLALQSVRQMGESEFPEVARGAKDLLEAARRRFELWDVPEYHIRELEKTGKVLRTLPIHSPITGTVIRMQARAGTYVTPGTELYFLADLSKIWILADVYEYELASVKRGQTAAVTLSYEPGTVLTGRVGFIYPTLDPKTRTAKVRFELDNLAEKLKPDMYANVELNVSLGIRLAIPQEAVIESGQKQVVFIHLGGGRLEPRLVKTGVKTGTDYEVVEGLKEGEHVVTSANFLIDSESRLKAVVESMGGMGMK